MAQATRSRDLTQIFGGPSADELSSEQRTRLLIAQNAFGELAKLVKNIQLYGTDHQANAKFRERLFDAMEAMLQHEERIEIGIGPYEFTLYEQPIYENTNPERNFVYRFFMDGVRALGFSQGLSRAELDSLVDILLLDWSDAALFEDDVVTMLWEKQFTHIDYAVLDSVQDGEGDGEAHHYTIAGVISNVRQRAEAKVEQIESARGRRVDPIDDGVGLTDANISAFADQPFAMDEAEFLTLRTLVRTTGRETLEKFIEILFKVSTDMPEADRAERVASIFTRIAELQLGGGQIGELERLMRKVRMLEQATRHGALIRQIFAAWSTPTFVTRVLRTLNDPDSIQAPSVLAVMELLDGSVVPDVVRQIDQIRIPERRAELLARVPVLIAGPKIALAVARLIKTLDPAIAHDVLAIIRSKNDPMALQAALRSGMQSDEPKVRLECLAILGPNEVEQFRDLLFKALDDPAKVVRSRALQALARSRDPDVFAHVMRCIEAKTFSGYDLDEKRRYFVVATLTGDPAARFLAILGHSSLLSRGRAHEEARHCAAVALAIALHPGAPALFDKELGRRLKSEVVAEACRWGKRHMDLDQKTRTKQLYDLFYRGALTGGAA